MHLNMQSSLRAVLGAMAPLKRSREQLREGENIFAWMMRRCKKPVNRLVVKVDGERSWDEMPHDILVDIIKRLGYLQKTYTISRMCKSWLYALLDSLFPPGDVLDLRLFDQIPDKYEMTRRVYGNCLWMVLNRRQYTKVFLPQRHFRKELFDDLAERLPGLNRDFLSTALYTMVGMFLYWPQLTEVHCHSFLISEIVVHCKQIRKLCLYGWIRDNRENLIANELPQLEHLDIQSCVLSARALAIILDGQKELRHLDTRHAARFDDKFLSRFGGNPFGKAIDWNEEEIRHKVASIKTYLECPRKFCSDCSIFYDSSVSRLGLRAFLLYCFSSLPHEPRSCLARSCLACKRYSSPVVSCLVHELGSILPSNFKPVEDDSYCNYSLSIRPRKYRPVGSAGV